MSVAVPLPPRMPSAAGRFSDVAHAVVGVDVAGARPDGDDLGRERALLPAVGEGRLLLQEDQGAWSRRKYAFCAVAFCGPCDEHHVRVNSMIDGLAGRRLHPRDEALAGERPPGALGGRDRLRHERRLLLAAQLGQLPALVEGKGEEAGLQPALLRRVALAGQEREVGVGAGRRLLQRAVGPEPHVELLGREVARPAAGGGGRHARHQRAAPHPQAHVLHRLRAVHRLRVVGDVHQEPVRGQPVAALHDLHAPGEPQQPLLALEARPARS